METGKMLNEENEKGGSLVGTSEPRTAVSEKQRWRGILREGRGESLVIEWRDDIERLLLRFLRRSFCRCPLGTWQPAMVRNQCLEPSASHRSMLRTHVEHSAPCSFSPHPG